MPYTLATIDEILRIASVASTGLQRRAKETKEFKGYLIEENSWVYGNLQVFIYSFTLFSKSLYHFLLKCY